MTSIIRQKSITYKADDKRKVEIDILKGVGILLVIIGHCSIPVYVKNTIYIFHMPLFFMLSGLLHKKNFDGSFGSFVRKKAISLMYPYFVLGTVIILYNSLVDVIRGIFTGGKLVKRVIALVYGGYIWENNYDYIGTLWFLCALFCVELIFEAILRICNRNLKAVIICSSLIAVIGCIISYGISCTRKFTETGSGYRLPYCLDIALVAVLFYCIGFCLANIESRNSRACNYRIGGVSFIVILIGIGLGWLNVWLSGNGIDMLYLQWGNPFLFFASALICCVGLYFAALAIVRVIHGKKMIINFLCSLGQNSLLMMTIHLYLKVWLEKFLQIIEIDHQVLIAVLLILISWLLSLIIKRYAPWLYKVVWSVKKFDLEKQ